MRLSLCAPLRGAGAPRRRPGRRPRRGGSAAPSGPLPKVEVGAIASGFIPVEPAGSEKASLWYAFFVGDLKATGSEPGPSVRGASAGFRPYYDAGVWLQEGYAWAATPVGDVRAGKSERAFGLADDTFTGTLFSDNGVTRNPFWGAGISGETRIGYDSLTWALRWEGLGDRNGSWEETGRGASSDPGTKLTDGATARVTYLVYKGLITLRAGPLRLERAPGVRRRAARLPAERPVAGPDRHGGATRPLGSLLRREGERRPPGALLNLAYDDARAGLVEFRAEFPTVIVPDRLV